MAWGDQHFICPTTFYKQQKVVPMSFFQRLLGGKPEVIKVHDYQIILPSKCGCPTERYLHGSLIVPNPPPTCPICGSTCISLGHAVGGVR